jgi:transcriptional regulator with XRE-family HTH domain
MVMVRSMPQARRPRKDNLERPCEALGRRIADARNAAGFSQEELAERISRSTSYVGQIESGTKCPRVPVVLLIARALNVSPIVLLSLLAGERQQSTERVMVGFDPAVVDEATELSRTSPPIVRAALRIVREMQMAYLEDQPDQDTIKGNTEQHQRGSQPEHEGA